MKLLTTLTISTWFLMTIPALGQAQTLSSIEQADIVQALQAALESEYLSVDRGTAYSEALQSFDISEHSRDAETFSADIHRYLQGIHSDGHLGVYAPERTRAILGSVEFRDPQPRPPVEPALQLITHLEPGIKLMIMANFSTDTYSQASISDAFSQLRPADTLIVDLRGNRGGDARVFRWMSSCLFATPTPIFAIAWRESDGIKETTHTSQPDPGCSMASQIPLIIMVDGLTASTAELVPFILRNRGRATIVGQPTYGASHAAEFYELPHGFGAMIPIGRTYDPVTGEDWESVGVPIDLMTDPDDTLETAISVARIRNQCLSMIESFPGYACEIQQTRP